MVGAKGVTPLTSRLRQPAPRPYAVVNKQQSAPMSSYPVHRSLPPARRCSADNNDRTRRGVPQTSTLLPVPFGDGDVHYMWAHALRWRSVELSWWEWELFRLAVLLITTPAVVAAVYLIFRKRGP